jgi:hypothetical protein
MIAGLLVMAELLAMAIVAALKLVAPTTWTLAVIARPLLRMASSTSHAICMALTASISTMSAVRIQRTKHTQTITTTTLKNTPIDVHYHDSRCHSSNNKLLVSCSSPALSNGNLSANKSGGNCFPENSHLDSFQIPKKRKVGNMGHKSQENNALLKAGVSPYLDAIFDDGVTVDSFLKAFQDDPGLSICDTNDAFKYKN